MQDIKIEYIKDAEGNEKAVMIPIEEWKKIEAHLEEVLQYASIKSGLKDAFLELREILKGNKTNQTISLKLPKPKRKGLYSISLGDIHKTKFKIIEKSTINFFIRS